MWRIITLTITIFSLNLYAITPADFAKSVVYEDVQISPDGKYLGLQLLQKEKSILIVLDRKTMKPVGSTAFGGKTEVGSFAWVNNERLVIQPAERKAGQEQRVHYGELYAVNYDGTKRELIYGFRSGEKQVGSKLQKRKAVFGWARIIDILPEDDKHILISSEPMSDKGDRIPLVYKINVYNGRLKKVHGSPIYSADFLTDTKGNLKLVTGLNSNYENKVFYLDKKDKWQEVSNFTYGNGFTPLTMADDNTLYTLDDSATDKVGLYKLDLKTGQYKTVFVDKEVDITNVQRTADERSIYAVRVDPDYPNYVMLNSASNEAKVFKKFVKAFPGHKLTVTSTDRKGENFVLYVSAAYKPGTYYVYDQKQDRLTKLFDVIPGVTEDKLLDVAPISFTASDGVKVSGYITQTLTDKQSPQPLVVLVHGGPHGVRDYWSYDSEMQMLASQGYRVLQVNFRGSGGYGQAFEQSGYLQWGDRVQKDIIEGTQWVIDQGLAIKDKVCIMGGSFGGYSAVQSAALAPDLFKCVVANAGVYDLEMMYKEGDIPQWYAGKSYLEEVVGKDSQQLKDYSPVHNVTKLKAPVFIAHGGQDERVPPEHAFALRKAMDNNNKEYIWFFKERETHGFYKQENRAEYYQKLSSFLKQHL